MTPETLGIERFADQPTPKRAALNARDLEVLRLLSEGCDTLEIARRLAYSDSLIKHVIQRLVAQFNARNRTHLVAIAVRAGLV